MTTVWQDLSRNFRVTRLTLVYLPGFCQQSSSNHGKVKIMTAVQQGWVCDTLHQSHSGCGICYTKATLLIVQIGNSQGRKRCDVTANWRNTSILPSSLNSCNCWGVGFCMLFSMTSFYIFKIFLLAYNKKWTCDIIIINTDALHKNVQNLGQHCSAVLKPALGMQVFGIQVTGVEFHLLAQPSFL